MTTWTLVIVLATNPQIELRSGGYTTTQACIDALNEAERRIDPKQSYMASCVLERR